MPKPAARNVERTLAGVLFVVTLPLLAALAAVVAALSRQPPFIAHRRMGQYGSELWVLKIRTMWARRARKRSGGWIERLAETSVPVVKCRPDPRVTSRFAAFCRRFSLDELPQLLHVAAGQMRFVGPRPITFAEWDAYYGTAMREVLQAPPGITGLWQVRGRNRLNYAQRRRLDLFYVRRRSAWLDWWIVARTPLKVLSGRDAA